MIRFIAAIVGLGFLAALVFALFGTVSTAITEPAAETVTEEFHVGPRSAGLSSAGMFGKFDLRQAQRGFQVYKEVCSACHSLSKVAFRDLGKLGYSDPEVKKIAADWSQPAADLSIRRRATAPTE